MGFIEFFDMIDRSKVYDLAIYISRMDTLKVLKELTYYISSSNAEIKTANDNQIDIDILNRHKNDARNLRKEIQINNQEIYKLNIYITLYNESKDLLKKDIIELRTKLYSKQIYSNITNFRNLMCYILTLPLNSYDNRLIEKTYRNITTLSLCNFFPFYTNTIFDKNGILFGYTKKDNRICNIDIFDDKYLNANMVILGSSGSGKSYFVKLLILKHYFKNKVQYIFDPEGEYANLAINLNCEVLSLYATKKQKCINLLDISKEEIKLYQDEILNKKVNAIVKYMTLILNLDEKKQAKLNEAIILSYNQKGINNEINSLYKDNVDGIIYIEKKLKSKDEFPSMKDVLKNIKDSKLKKLLQVEFIEKYPFFADYTNISNSSNIIVFDTSKSKADILEFSIFYLLNMIDIKLKDETRKNSILIYIDEIWKYITLKNVVDMEAIIYSLYKSIRKNNAGIVTITQDISDLFLYNEGSFGKSILNNSAFKIFFKLEFSDNEVLKKLNIINDLVLEEILRLEKRNAIMTLNNNIVSLNIKSNDIERKIILGSIDENISGS